MSALLSLGHNVFARGFESESILKLNSAQVQKIGAYLIQSGRGNIAIASGQGPQSIAMGKANITGLVYDVNASLQNLNMNNVNLLATFGYIDSEIRIGTITYNDIVTINTGSVIGDFTVSFQCKNISLHVSASQATLSMSDLNTASLGYSQLQASGLKIESCTGLNDAAQMIASVQNELLKQLQDPTFFNQVYKPQIMPALVSLLLNSQYSSQIAGKEVQVQPRDMKIENAYLYLASDIHIPDPTHSEVADFRVNQAQEGINISKPFIFSLFNDVAFKGKKVLKIPSSQIPGLDSIRYNWFAKLFVLPELLSYSSSIPLHVEVQQVSETQFYVALVAETNKGDVRVIAAYMNMKLNLDAYANDGRDFMQGVDVVRGSSRFGFFSDYFVGYVNEQMSGYRSSLFEHLQIPGLKDFGVRINLVE